MRRGEGDLEKIAAKAIESWIMWLEISITREVLDMDDKMIYSYIDEIGKRLADPGLYGAASLMVGAGFSKNANCVGDKKNTPPDWTQLSEMMYEELYPFEKDNEKRKWGECSGKNVLTLAQKYEVTFDRRSLNSLIERSIADKNYVPGELHRNLLELNWNDVFTTNYDTLLERAIEQVATRKNYKIVYSQDDLPGSVRPRLVKLHGSIEHSNQYIITEEDYRTYPDKYAPFVNTVQQSMLETRLCLLGFSGEDPNFLNWLGWLRDSMGENCPAIYLCGLFDNLGIAERKMLEQRHITILDLSILVDKTEKNQYYTSIKKFIELLKQKSEKKKENILTQRPYEYTNLKNNESKMDMSKYAKDMKSITTHLIDKLDDYVCLPLNEAKSISSYIYVQLDLVLNTEVFEDKYVLINSYCRILKECNCPLYDNVADKLRIIVDDINIDWDTKTDVILYLLQMYRIDGRYDDYLHVKNDSAVSLLDGIRKKNEYWIESVKYYMCILDINKAYECLEKIEISSYDEWALKKASLLNQLNKRKEAKELITTTVAFISQQKYSENKNASLIGYANLVARASWMMFDGQELFSDSLYEDNQFNCRKIVITSKETIIETIFENQRPQNQRVNSFNPNTYTINYTIGSTGELKKTEESFKYLLLQDLLCIGIYSDHKNSTDAAIKNIDNTSYSPLWRWYKILKINDKNIYNLYFTRERIYSTDMKFVKIFYDQIISLIEAGLGDCAVKEKMFVDYKTLTDIAAKMTIVLDEDRILKLIRILIQIDEEFTDEHEKKSIVNEALRIMQYSFNCKVFNGCINYILDNKLLEYRFTSYFNNVDYGIEDVDEKLFQEKLINSMKIELDSENSMVRDNAVNKFKLFEKIIIDSECYEQILDKVWNQVDEFGLPLNSTYLPIAWIEDKKHEAEEKTIGYLLHPQISRDYHESVICSRGDVDDQVQGYCTVLYYMMKIKNNNIFSGEQLFDIVKYFNDYVKHEKKLVNSGFDIMGQIEHMKNKLNKINNIVMLLCISAKVSNLYSEELERIVNSFLSQMDDLKIHTESIRVLLGNVDANVIFTEFEKMILGGDEKEFSTAFTMLYGAVQILHNKNEESSLDDLIIQFIHRIPYLEMRIGKRIMLELHSVLRRKIFLNKENIKYVTNMLKLCYEIFKQAKEEHMKDGLDGMYNVSNLAKAYYKFLKENSIKIGRDFEALIRDFKECKLNEIKFNWL